MTQRGSNRQRVFYSTSDQKMYLSLVSGEIEDTRCRILAYCLMRNHVRLVVIPECDDSPDGKGCGGTSVQKRTLAPHSVLPASL